MKKIATPAAPCLALALVALAAATLLLAAAAPGAGGVTLAPGQGPLDGMVFVGDFGAAGAPPDKTDKLYFGEGHFWSANCVPCGFAPGEYWVRRNGDAMHFRGELHSAERGRFVYEGAVRDGRIEVLINWRHERWYWTIEREFRFAGVLAAGERAENPAESARLAGMAVPDPQRCNL